MFIMAWYITAHKRASKVSDLFIYLFIWSLLRSNDCKQNSSKDFKIKLDKFKSYVT